MELGTVGDDDDYADSFSSKQCECRLQFALELILLYIIAARERKNIFHSHIMDERNADFLSVFLPFFSLQLSIRYWNNQQDKQTLPLAV